MHMPLHSNEWKIAKEMEGETIYQFTLNESNASCDIPISLRRFGFLNFGWMPYGLPYQGNGTIVRDKLRDFLGANKLIGLLTYSFNTIPENELARKYGLSIGLKRFSTYILRFNDETTSNIINYFNATTKKHIRRAFDSGFQITPMQQKDIKHFYQSYLELCNKNQFSPICTERFLLNLFRLCEKSSERGLKFFGLKSERNGETHGYLIGLSSGGYFFEFIRANTNISDHKGYDRKLLTYRMITCAQEKGDSYYDFGGINPKSGPGIMEFKRGFGGTLYKSQPMKIISRF